MNLIIIIDIIILINIYLTYNSYYYMLKDILFRNYQYMIVLKYN